MQILTHFSLSKHRPICGDLIAHTSTTVFVDCLLYILFNAPPYGMGALSDTAIRPSVCPMAQLPRL